MGALWQVGRPADYLYGSRGRQPRVAYDLRTAVAAHSHRHADRGAINGRKICGGSSESRAAMVHGPLPRRRNSSVNAGTASGR